MFSFNNGKSIRTKFIKASFIAATSAVTVFSALVFAGCSFVSNAFHKYVEYELDRSQAERDELIEKSRGLLTVYLDSVATDYTIGEISCMNANSGNPSEYLSPVTEAMVVINGEEFIFYIDTDTENIYSNMQHESFKRLYISELFGDRIDPSEVALNIVTDLKIYSTTKATNRQIYTTIFDAYPVTESATSIFEKARNGEMSSIALLAYFNSDNYNYFEPDYLKDYMDSHSEISRLSLYSISTGVVEKLQDDFKTYEPGIAREIDFLADPLAVKEEYYLYYTNNNLTFEYKQHTLAEYDYSVGVNYISYEMKMGNEDFSLYEENEYTIDITVTDLAINTYAPANGSTAYLFFYESPGSSATVKLPGSYTADSYDICIYPCGYYSLTDSAQNDTTDYGYEITRDEIIRIK